MPRKKDPDAKPPLKRRMFGGKVEAELKRKEAARIRARMKKFPTMKEAGRPVPQNRHSNISPQEKKIVQLLLEDQPQDLNKEQIDQMAKLLRRNPETIKALVVKAREDFVGNAKLYVEVHAKAVQLAYMNGDFHTAANHAEWAIENIESEGESIVTAASKRQVDNSPKVLINIPLGGITPTQS